MVAGIRLLHPVSEIVSIPPERNVMTRRAMHHEMNPSNDSSSVEGDSFSHTSMRIAKPKTVSLRS